LLYRREDDEYFFCNFALMKMTEKLQQFVHDHETDDSTELLLSASRYMDVDVKTAVVQIKASIHQIISLCHFPAGYLKWWI